MLDSIVCACFLVFILGATIINEKNTMNYRDSVISLLTQISEKVGK